MSSITRHHAEWLSLLEISGPFLSMPVLLQTFPHGLDAHKPELSQLLKAAHEEWADNQAGLRPNPAIHTAWVQFVLKKALEYSDEILLEGQSIPGTLKVEIPEHGVTLRPDYVLGETLTPGLSPKGERGERLLIKVYPREQELDKPVSGWRWKASAETQMMELLHATNIKLGLVTNGEQWMLVHASRGETTGFISWYAHLWFDEPLTLRAFQSLLGTRCFFGVPEDEALAALLEKSAQDQHAVTDQLGYQVRNAVEILIRDLDKADIDRGRTLLSDIGEDRLYEAALTVMMRLVFLLSAEERGLLPLDDPFYADNYAISTLGAQLRETADQHGEDLLERLTDSWNRLLATFRAVYAGVRHDRMSLLAYGGSLFDPDRFPFLEGRPKKTSWLDTPADPLPVDNRTVLHLLEALQYLQVPVPGGRSQGSRAESRRLSFRALDIEQIGHVYESLLDHIAVRADQPVLGLVGTKNKQPEIPLTELEAQLSKGLDAFADHLKTKTGRSVNALKKGVHAELDAFRAQRLRAACGNDEALYKRVIPFSGLLRDDETNFPVVIPEGGVYVTAGPTRRATGTHYTPRSLTEPIVQHTLEPQVYEGPAEGWPREKWKLHSPKHILELKVCDMAMGSGAFLVQACRYLSERLVEAWEEAENSITSNNSHTLTSARSPSDTHNLGQTLTPAISSNNSLTPGFSLTPALSQRERGNEGEMKAAMEPEFLARVRELRRDATDAEKLLWQLLRNRQLHGFKFRRQHPIGGYILDFYCHEANLAVELDGGGHREENQAKRDRERTEYLESKGLRVIRFWNDQVLEQTEAVLGKILESLTDTLTPTLSSSDTLTPALSPSNPLTPALSQRERESRPSPRGRRVGDEGLITIEGLPTDDPNQAIPPGAEDRLALARRLVADRCLYGVDKNPLAVEMAKLSLWLITLDKNKPFTFLDHSLKCGDSLVGASEEDYLRWAHGDLRPQGSLFDEFLQQQLETARQKRRDLQSFQVLDVRDAERKAQLLQEADEAMERIKLGCDLIAGVKLLGLSQSEQEGMLGRLLLDYVASEAMEKPDALRALGAAQKENDFHWEFEFPEVFEKGGFSSFIGNPPFVGGRRIRETFGNIYRDALYSLFPDSSGNADYCSFFFIKAFSILRLNGTTGLIATNTISQGDTRQTGLEKITNMGGIIYAANINSAWPGSSSVIINIVYIAKGLFSPPFLLDGKEVLYISPRLDSYRDIGKPHALIRNKEISFQGSVVVGLGFVLEPDEAKKLIENEPNNKDVIFPYLNGQDLNSNPNHFPERWVINFHDWSLEKAEKYVEPMSIIREKVYPVRMKVNRKAHKKYWWQYGDKRPALYNSIAGLKRVLVTARVTKYLAFVFVPNGWVYNEKTFVLPFEDYAHFCVLQSTIHNCWVWKYSSTLGKGLNYAPTDCLENFPFPKTPFSNQLHISGEKYHKLRRMLMLHSNEGLTDIYNRFHDPDYNSDDILQMRNLHIDMDKAVVAAYGWDTLKLDHGFYETQQDVRFTIREAARQEILERLLEFNHERYQEEVAQGLHEKKGRRKSSKGSKKNPRVLKENKGQYKLL
jgi:very-short-patch-repair endonuclease